MRYEDGGKTPNESDDCYPVNEEARRLREQSLDGTLVLEDDEIITYAGRLMIGYRRHGGIYSAPQGGEFIANDLILLQRIKDPGES